MVDITRVQNNAGFWEVTWKFEDESFETLQTISEELNYKVGTTIFREGDPADGMYLVIDGTVRIIRKTKSGQNREINTIREGQSFGELGLLIERPRHASAVAGSDLTCLKITRSALDLLHKSAPDMAYMMYQVLARSLAEQLLHTEEIQQPD
ncbi:MAG: cyclic nucleotide-binding domain-containing protein [Chloroflexota bacterium]